MRGDDTPILTIYAPYGRPYNRTCLGCSNFLTGIDDYLTSRVNPLFLNYAGSETTCWIGWFELVPAATHPRLLFVRKK